MNTDLMIQAINAQLQQTIQHFASQVLYSNHVQQIFPDHGWYRPIIPRDDMNVKWICDYAGVMHLSAEGYSDYFVLHLRKMTAHCYRNDKLHFATKLYLYKGSVAFNRDSRRHYSQELDKYYQHWIANRITK